MYAQINLFLLKVLLVTVFIIATESKLGEMEFFCAKRPAVLRGLLLSTALIPGTSQGPGMGDEQVSPALAIGSQVCLHCQEWRGTGNHLRFT